jgi:hypothetical protein
MISNFKTSWMFIVLVTLTLLSTLQQCYAEVSGSVDSSVRITTEGDCCAELTNITATVNQSKREVTFSFNYRAWNDYRTPIVQLHIMRGGRVINTFYNGVPPKSPGCSGKAFVTVPVPYGASYDIKLCMTLARSVEQGAAHAEQGGGHSRVFAKIKSD